MGKIQHTKLGLKKDKSKSSFYRSKQDWERGKGAKKKGNPRYEAKMILDKNGNKRKVYVVRKPRKNEKRYKNN